MKLLSSFKRPLFLRGLLAGFPAGRADAYKIKAMFFDLKAADTRRSHHHLHQATFDRQFHINNPLADAADQVVVRVFGSLKIGDRHTEIEFSHRALSREHAQVTIYRSEAQMRMAPPGELIYLVSRQMTSMSFNGVKDHPPLFGIAVVHRVSVKQEQWGIGVAGQQGTGLSSNLSHVIQTVKLSITIIITD